MLNKALLSALLFLSLTGCAVYGGGYDRGYYNDRSYRYHDGYRRDHYSPPVYVTPRYYYEDRRQHYHPAPAPRHHYRHDQRRRDGYKRHDQPRYDYRRNHGLREHQGKQVQRGWDAGRNTQQRFSNGRGRNEQRGIGERRR